MLERDSKYVWHPFTQVQTEPEILDIVEAKGTTLTARDGKTYLDCNSSWWVNVHGHGHPHIQKAINEQFEKIDHIIFAGATHEKGIELAERICNILPNNHFEKVFYSDNGSTAIEVALKMCFQYWHNQSTTKNRVLALEGAYHGDTFGAMSVGERDYFNKPFEPFFFDVDYLAFPTKESEEGLLNQAEKLFASNEFVALIVEPIIQGSAGMRTYRSEWLDKLVKIAKKHEVLVIFDEVMTGWGRTGKMFAMNHLSELPDIVCLSKGLTGGVLPLGLTVTTQKIFDAFLSPERVKAFLHGHSFTGNPIACAAACASIDLFEQKSTWENIERICKSNIEFATQLKTNTKIQDVRICGTILAIELKTGEGNTYFSSKRDENYLFFRNRGLLLRPLGNVIFINPPYSITTKELNYVYECILEFLNSNN